MITNILPRFYEPQCIIICSNRLARCPWYCRLCSIHNYGNYRDLAPAKFLFGWDS